jgi:endonuclease YncB( thermonuclease family)
VLIGVGAPGMKITKDHLRNMTISIPYGELSGKSVGQWAIHSTDEVQFQFKDGRLDWRVRAVSMNPEGTRWKLFLKGIGEPERENGETESKQNPYGVAAADFDEGPAK